MANSSELTYALGSVIDTLDLASVVNNLKTANENNVNVCWRIPQSNRMLYQEVNLAYKINNAVQ